jgi:hypothetical protein
LYEYEKSCQKSVRFDKECLRKKERIITNYYNNSDIILKI